MEGKDRATQLGKKKWEDLGKTVGLMLQMCEPIFSTGKCVVLDSVFCVSKGITALLEVDVYAAALIKKRKYWPKGHKICCALTPILWRAQIVKGKDRPTELGKKKWEELGKTVGLMLRMCEPVFSLLDECSSVDINLQQGCDAL